MNATFFTEAPFRVTMGVLLLCLTKTVLDSALYASDPDNLYAVYIGHNPSPR